MRYFFTVAIGTIFLLIIYNGYQKDFGNSSTFPVDHEQTGLSDQIIIRFSHIVAENTPKGLAANKFAELIEEKTDGQIKVEVYPNGMLYSDDTEMQALQDGDIQMIAPSFSKLTAINPDWQVLDLPFLFNDYDDVENIFIGDVGQLLLEDLDENNIKGLTFWSNGFKQMTSKNHALITPDDFKEVKVRTMPSAILIKQFLSLGAEPSTASFDQVFSILENSKIDAQENTLSNIYTKGFHQVQDYLTISNHGFLGYAVLMNEDFWNKLSPNLQSQVLEAIEETTIWNISQSEQMNNDTLTKLQQIETLSIHTLSADEQEEWQKKFEHLYEFYENDINPNLIEMIREEINR